MSLSAMNRLLGFLLQRFEIINHHFEMPYRAIQFMQVNVYVVLCKLLLITVKVTRDIGGAGRAIQCIGQALIKGLQLLLFGDQMFFFKNSHVTP